MKSGQDQARLALGSLLKSEGTESELPRHLSGVWLLAFGHTGLESKMSKLNVCYFEYFFWS